MRSESEQGEDEIAASLVDALLVYAEPLADRAHAVVIGDAEGPIAARLLELGARSVAVFDPDPARAAEVGRDVPRGITIRALTGALDIRDGSFDLAIVPDLADLDDPLATVARLRAAIARDGTLLALGRARVESGMPPPFSGELGPAVLPYNELYDLFAAHFSDVTLAGVLPFSGIVFAELGNDRDEPAVSVDTRLVAPEPPSVFVVVACDDRDRRAALDPYAIIQVDEVSEEIEREGQLALEVVVAAAQLKADLVNAQLEELKDRLVLAEVRAVEVAARLDRANGERDVALTRAMEVESVLSAAQEALSTLERRLLEAERGCLDRDDRLATLSAELDSRRSSRPDMNALLLRAERAEAALQIAQEELSQRLDGNPTDVDVRIEDVAELLARAERAETDLAHVADGHAAETAAFESQLRDRARLIASLEKELLRREHLVRELVASVEEHSAGTNARVFEAAAPLPSPSDASGSEGRGGTPPSDAALRKKLDELATDIARREGELTARGWRIRELEDQLRAVPPAAAPAPPAPAKPLVDELDALRQALTQEHAARVAAESGEELSQARAELARQSALLEQIRAQRERS